MSELWEKMFKRTKKEEEIWNKIQKENEEFESTPEYIAHRERLDALYKEHHEAAIERSNEAKEYRRKRFPRKEVTPLSEEERQAVRDLNKKKWEEKVNSYPKKLRDIIFGYESLSDKEKTVFAHETWSYAKTELDEMKGKQITHEQVRQLHDILVQTCIDFINENGLKDVDEVHFNADALQTSAKYNEWVPDTDSFLEVDGIEWDDDIKYHVRKFIDRSF
jgi:hypothetical protein